MTIISPHRRAAIASERGNPATDGRSTQMFAPDTFTWLKSMAILCCLVGPLSADTFGLFTYTNNATSITITSYPATAVGPVEIPASIVGKPVTSIGTQAFNGSYTSSFGTDPHGPDSSHYACVTRGGDWDHDADYSRVACRVSESAGYAWNHIGFRIVRPPPPTADTANTAIDTYRMNLTIISTHGTVSGAGQCVPNTTATLTPTPDPGYIFSKWTGDATGKANPLSVVMDSDMTITAVFGADGRDPDGDGLTNYQEIVVYGTNPNEADTDGDGYLDGYEVQTGHAPLNALDHPPLVAEARTAIEFTFPSAIGKAYRIEGSPDLTTWATVESGIAGNGGVIQRFYSTRDTPKRYFRVADETAP